MNNNPMIQMVGYLTVVTIVGIPALYLLEFVLDLMAQMISSIL